MVGDGTRGAATGGADSSFSTTLPSFHGVTLLYTAGTVSAEVFEVMRMIFRVAPKAIEPDHSTIEPIADLSRRTWSRAATPAHSADSTTAAW